MANVYEFSQAEIMAFFLVLVRISAFVVSWPVFGVRTVPMPVKILFSLSLSLVIFPIVSWRDTLEIEFLSNQIIFLTIREVFIGLSFGFLARMFFYTLRVAGQVISVSMGLASSQVFNPAVGERTTVVQQFLIAMGTLFFLAINGHHIFVAGIIESFDLVPLSHRLLNTDQFVAMGDVVQKIMEIGVKICSPVMISILFMNLSMAVIGRAVPQINVLITSLPVNILTGMLVMLVSLPLMVWQMHDLLDITANHVFQMLKSY